MKDQSKPSEPIKITLTYRMLSLKIRDHFRAVSLAPGHYSRTGGRGSCRAVSRDAARREPRPPEDLFGNVIKRRLVLGSMSKHLTLISQYAFYPMHWEAFRFLCSYYDVQASVIATSLPELPEVHRQLGWVAVEEARRESFHPDIRLLPPMSRRHQRAWLCQQLDDLQPNAIWVQEEPTNRLLIETLRYYRRNPNPRIICAVAENIFRIRWWRRWQLSRYWRRLDRLIAVASSSVSGIRAAGMPARIPADVLVAGAQEPSQPVQPMPLPLRRDAGDWIVAFAGRVCEEKGWKVLLDAIELLPAEFKVVLAGDGPQVEQLRMRISSPSLAGRAAYLGLLPKADVWRFYKAADCLAAPHLTFPHWKEQFGGVLADAMALGLPIVGSDSGSIPEVVGHAGLIVPENDRHALAAAIRRLRDEAGLYRQLSHNGPARFAREFAIPAYAQKIAAALELIPRSPANVAAA